MKLKIDNVSHTYNVEVLHNLEFSLEGYNSIAIIGVSGSGKSTLIRLMSGIEVPTSGDIFIDDFYVQDPVYKKQVGFVFQSHNLFPHLTLKRNITLILEKTRDIEKEEANQIAEQHLTLLHLEDQMDKLPKHVSGGQAQRASIARALSINPDVVFLDEPTSALDPILTHEVLTAVEELKGFGKQFIFVTHVMSFVKDFADYVIFMDDGYIKEHGEPSILDNPKTDELKAFMHRVR
ncbi:amino acid ABC transporter ATP-binding protein [Candidatus Xianfuyuplasma coldseepsis]|uniref:Amino acid ABC transporter ATP-binding protein n=1 Tax=Candidatus Xianfuyuplasma coldseepsis TaxID=2782163 RepID=A0A7L7KPA6_9MOLU|nr:ATP-binding cassette domain-containing protein [Xianfuyuplasma coldseepsis]QMS84611.1 amino acid ABC transporter ATP-binding protein [Xianfuyuplasma coldseepsis]